MTAPIRVMSVFGTRPDTIKMAPVVHALREAGPDIESLTCVTAQHRGMVDDLLELFSIEADDDLDVMQAHQTLTDITTRVLTRMAPVLAARKPDVVLVHGDTSTSTAAALASFYAGIPVGHVEAGLRTHDPFEPYPEEMNRRLTGRIASWHFAPTQRAYENLRSENVQASDIFVTGNTVIDAFLSVSRRAFTSDPAGWERLDPRRPLIFVTAHRRENHEAMSALCEAFTRIAALPERPQLLWPVHPSPKVAPIAHALLDRVEGIILTDPLNYADVVRTVQRSRFLLTDSGGLQEEAPCLGRPVLVMRRQTERPEGLEAGTLELVGNDPDLIVARATALLRDQTAYERMARAHNPYGDGHAAERIVAALRAKLRGAVIPEMFVA